EVRARTSQLAHVVREREVQEQILQRAELQIVPLDPRGRDRLRGTAVDRSRSPRDADPRQQLTDATGFDRRACFAFAHPRVLPQPSLRRRRTVGAAVAALMTYPCDPRPFGPR